MKQSSIIIMFSMLMSMVSTKASADSNIKVANADGVIITYYWGMNNELCVTWPGNYMYDKNIKYSGNIVIPESVEYEGVSYPVTTIGEAAFNNCSELESITIPNSVKTIGKSAFMGCSGLTSITIPNSVTSIGSYAFDDCTSLNSLIIGNSVTTIGIDPFTNCTSLTSVIIPNSVTDIESGLFIGCNNLNKIEFHNKIIGYDRNGFETFSGLPSLSEIVIGKEVTSITGSFSRCPNLATITVEEGNPTYDSRNNCNAIIESSSNKLIIGGLNTSIPNSVTSIGDVAFATRSGLTSISIPNSVTYLSGFSYCTGLTSIEIPNSVTTIGGDAFRGCSGLTSITMPNSIKVLEYGAFRDCTGLTSITIPNSVTSIGNWAFDGCSGLSSVHITDIEAWCRVKMSDPFSCAHHLFLNGEEITNLIIPSDVTSINSYVFSWCSNLTSVTIPNSVKSIGGAAFKECSGLTSVTIGNSVTQLTGFSGCTSLTSISIPNNVTSVGSSAFSGCTGLTSITIPNSVTSIGNDAFAYCSGLTSITIPNNVTSIDQYAFRDCSGLTSVIIGNSVTSIGNGAFFNCSGLTSITIPNSVTSIGVETFHGCSGLITASISNNMTKIPAALFRDCTNLKTVYLGKSANEVDYPGGYKGGNPYGWNPFRGCNNLQNVIIASDEFPHMIDYNYFTNIDNCRFIMKQSTYDSGIPNSDQKYIKYIATYSKQPMVIELKSKGATSAVYNICPIDEEGLFDVDNMKTVRTTGLTPGEQLCWKLDEENYGILSDKTNEIVTLTVEEPKALSTTKARLLATAEEADDMVHFGFEWRRYDAPDGVQSSKVSSPLYNGQIVGTLNNLKDDIYYKYRPFYKSDSGETYYGEWIGLFTGDADVFYEPEVYTKDAEDITKVSALLAGAWFEGTDDIQEKGFEYWTISNAMTRAVGNDVKKVAVSGSSNAMTATLEGLKSGATYGFRSYIKTTNGNMAYGEEKTFKTKLIGDVNGDGEVTKADAKAVADHIIGNTPAGFNKKMADVNNDGDVNVIDIVLLVKMIE